MSNYKLCIFFLTNNERYYGFNTMVSELNNCKYKDQIQLLVLTNSNDSDYYNNILSKTSINYIITQFDVNNNYMNKVHHTLTHSLNLKIPYLMKHDNDILVSTHIYDYLFENLDVLQDSNNLLLTPTLTSGIPTVEQFIQDYLNEDEKKILQDIFKEYRFESTWNVDYSSLNKCTIESNTWDSKEFFNSVKSINTLYKGVHPIRLYEKAINTLNQYVIKYKDIINKKQEMELIYDNTSPYFCNSIYCIKTDIYNKIIGTPEYFIDIYDEVPLNRYRDQHNLNIIYTKNGSAVHIIYNSIQNHFEKEHTFIENYLVSLNTIISKDLSVDTRYGTDENTSDSYLVSFNTILSKYSSIDTTYGTDKNTSHSYGELYDTLYKDYRNLAHDVLEIGIDSGFALQAYSEYFTKANIYGIDIKDNVNDVVKHNNKITIYIHDIPSYENVFNKEYDIIIEDASHELENQIKYFESFASSIKQNGLYIIEDVHEQNVNALKEATLPVAEKYGFIFTLYDLRSKKNRFDDIVFVFKKV